MEDRIFKWQNIIFISRTFLYRVLFLCCFPINIIRLDIKFETNYASRRMFGEPIKRGHSFALLLGIYSDGIPSTDFVLLSNKDRASFLKDYQTYVSEYVRQV